MAITNSKFLHFVNEPLEFACYIVFIGSETVIVSWTHVHIVNRYIIIIKYKTGMFILLRGEYILSKPFV